jgi:hypothetical protein
MARVAQWTSRILSSSSLPTLVPRVSWTSLVIPKRNQKCARYAFYSPPHVRVENCFVKIFWLDVHMLTSQEYSHTYTWNCRGCWLWCRRCPCLHVLHTYIQKKSDMRKLCLFMLRVLHAHKSCLFLFMSVGDASGIDVLHKYMKNLRCLQHARTVHVYTQKVSTSCTGCYCF